MSDIDLIHGTTRVLDVAVTDDDGVAVDITGSALHFTVKPDWLSADSAAVISKATGDGIAITDATGGLATITIDADDWASVENEPARYVYGLVEKDSSDRVWRLDTGTLLVAPAVLETVP